MSLELVTLAKIINRLDKNWQLYQQDTSDQQIRDALIKCFEWTYSLCFKNLKDHLEEVLSYAEAVHQMSFDQLVRHAWATGLFNEEIAQWRIFREKISTAAQAYDEEKALEVCAIIPQFLAEAQYLYTALLKRQTHE